jgi:ABC-type oligopeptide transport system substrate-binding subunit
VIEQLVWRRSSFLYLLLFLFLAGGIFSACGGEQAPATIVVTEVVEVAGETLVITRLIEPTVTPSPTPLVTPPVIKPVTLDISLIRETAPNIDPQKVSDPDGIDLVENLFVGLTRFNNRTNLVDPWLAREWEVDNNGRIWTFRLRDDVFWVRPSEIEENGIRQAEAVRPVVAGDIVYAIQRTCNRATDTPDAFILFIIKGCEDVYKLPEATPADLDRIGALALDDTTLQITLNKPASYFLTITTMPLMRPVPPELIDELGNDWLTAEEFMTSGPYLPLDSSLQSLHANSLWPFPHPEGGNVDVVNIRYLDEAEDALTLWEARSLDLIDATDLDRADFNERTAAHEKVVTNQTLFYIGFNFDSGVFREAEVRRALSAAIDRKALAEELFGIEAAAMRHLSPPGVVGAPDISLVGVGYSPDYARLQMAESGFGSCRLMPEATLLVSTSDLSLLQAELIRKMWIDEFGCTEEQFVIEQAQFGTLLANTRPDAGAARPDAWELGWSSYYPDANNWLGDLLHCEESENRQNRPCSEVDALIRRAGQTIDLRERLDLYREIENMFFGEAGSTPVIPLYVRGETVLQQIWLEYIPALFGGEQYDTYRIDFERKELEQSR